MNEINKFILYKFNLITLYYSSILNLNIIDGEGKFDHVVLLHLIYRVYFEVSF